MSRARLPVLSLLALLAPLLAAGCGEGRLPLEHWVERLSDANETRREEAIREVGRYGRDDPGRVVPRLVALLEQERGRRVTLGIRAEVDPAALPEGAGRSSTLTQLAHGLLARLRLLGLPAPHTRIDGERIDLLVVPRPGVVDVDAEQAELVRLLSRPGAVELRAELPPPFATSPERPVSPFVGDRAAYDAWLAEDTRRFEAAAAGGPAYVPSEAGRELVARSPEADGKPGGPVPVLVPRDIGELFTERDLPVTPRDDPFNGTPSLFVGVVDSRVEAFDRFLARHAGLTLWLVVDGTAMVSGRLPGQPSRPVAFPVRAPTLGEARTRAAKLTALLTLGRYPVPVRIQALPRAPLVAPDEAIPRALMEVGPAAEPALEELVRKDASWKPLVDRISEGILRAQTRTNR